MQPAYSLDKIKFATDGPTFEKAVELYEKGNDTLCKHMVALAIYAVMRGKPLADEDKKLVNSPVCSGRLEGLSKEELAVAKKAITSAMRYIKAYTGPSRIWFTYQNSLSEGRWHGRWIYRRGCTDARGVRQT